MRTKREEAEAIGTICRFKTWTGLTLPDLVDAGRVVTREPIAELVRAFWAAEDAEDIEDNEKLTDAICKTLGIAIK